MIKKLYGKYVNRKGLLIGNGISRDGIDLKGLGYRYTVGCNALYLDFLPTFLVTQNIFILREYIEKEVWKKSIVISKGGAHFAGEFPENRFYFYESGDLTGLRGRSVGYMGLVLMLKMGFGRIDMVGMDFDMTNVYIGRHLQYSRGKGHIGEGSLIDGLRKQYPNTIIQKIKGDGK